MISTFPPNSCRQLAHARHVVLCPPYRRHVEEGLDRSPSTGPGWAQACAQHVYYFGITCVDRQSSRILRVVPVSLIILTSICSSLALALRRLEVKCVKAVSQTHRRLLARCTCAWQYARSIADFSRCVHTHSEPSTLTKQRTKAYVRRKFCVSSSIAYVRSQRALVARTTIGTKSLLNDCKQA